MRLGARVGAGSTNLHNRTMLGVRPGRIELDELWAYVGKKQRNVTRKDGAAPDQSALNLLIGERFIGDQSVIKFLDRAMP